MTALTALTERLRHKVIHDDDLMADMRAAADEIERLRAALQKIASMDKDWDATAPVEVAQAALKD